MLVITFERVRDQKNNYPFLRTISMLILYLSNQKKFNTLKITHHEKTSTYFMLNDFCMERKKPNVY